MPIDHAIATGNWGCGVFKGDTQLKLLIQWIAASYVQGRHHIIYSAFGDKSVSEEKLAPIRQKYGQMPVCNLYNAVVESAIRFTQ
jgi:hypothetical protein